MLWENSQQGHQSCATRSCSMLGLECCKLYPESVGDWDISLGFVNWEDQLSALLYSKYVINVLSVDRQSRRVRSLSQGEKPRSKILSLNSTWPSRRCCSSSCILESLQNDCPLVRLMGMWLLGMLLFWMLLKKKKKRKKVFGNKYDKSPQTAREQTVQGRSLMTLTVQIQLWF